MHLSNWLVFCGVAFLVCFSPGPRVLLAISNAMAHGKRDWVASSLGNATGLIISGVAMSLLSHLSYVLVARMFKRQLTDPLRQRLFNRVSGGLFVLLGLSLLRLKNKVAA